MEHINFLYLDIKIKDVEIDNLKDGSEEGVICAKVSLNNSKYVKFFEYIYNRKVDQSQEAYFYLNSYSEFRSLIKKILSQEDINKGFDDDLFNLVCDKINKQI